LHCLNIRNRSQTALVADMLGIAEATADATLASAEKDGLVVARTGVLAGWSMTPEGQAVHLEWLEAEMAGTEVRAALAAAYEQFGAHNQALKQACTDWQLRDPATLNDHSDPAYDAAVIDRLAGVHAAATPALAAMAAAVPSFGRYEVRLGGALGRIQDGDRDAIARPLANSYHDIWMELHEDLLVRLGLTRGSDDT
jgi:hypothetical protein